MSSIVSCSFWTDPPRAGAAHVGDLREDVDPVAGEVLGQMVHLPRKPPPGETEDREDQA